MKNLSKIWILLLITVILLIYRNWFISIPIIGGDFSLSGISIKDIGLYPFSWFLSGLGYNGSFLLFTYPLSIVLFVLASLIGVSLAENLLYFYSFIILSLFSSGYVFKKIFKESSFWIISSLLFTVNTYILMVVGGGQVGIALSYAITPLVIYCFAKLIDSENLKNSFIAALILSLQLIFDLRIAYITLTAILIYWLVKVFENINLKYFLKSILFTFIIPGVISFFINFFWILPTIATRQNPIEQLGVAYSTEVAVKYLSFANFENAIGLMHPNWPENIFGKIGFMKPEFLLLPILAFAGFFFVSKFKDLKSKTYVLYFALLGLLGVFLAKGANDPFGGAYLWMFDHFPGFIMFRDPTKWYTLIAVSYSILIPFSIWKIYELLKLKTINLKLKITKYIPGLFIILVLGYLLFLIRPALLGKLTGTFNLTVIPNEYVRLGNYLSSQNNFSRTFWVPTAQRFGFSSYNHPVIAAANFFQLSDNSQIIKKLKSENTEKLLQESGVKYVIIPYDSQGEIFLKDRKYSEKMYLQIINQVKSISWLKEVERLNKIVIFEVPNSKDHFYISKPPDGKAGQLSAPSNQKITYKYVSPVEYLVKLENVKKGELLVFAESYDLGWAASDGEHLINSVKFSKLFNSFSLEKDGTYSLKVYYQPQTFVNAGIIISLITFIIVILTLLLTFGHKFSK
jgi:hypothetical protein